MDYETLRPLIFKLQPEQAHKMTVGLLRLAGVLSPARWLLRMWFRPAGGAAEVRAFGLTFPNAIGLAAGYDKDGLAWRGLAALGFGHVEVGTVTLRPQPGNPGPRVFRLPDERAIINRMGFPSQGSDVVARRLAGPRPHNFVLGVNIGKNKATPLDEAADDYLALLQTFGPLADYLAINISSPNTPGLRSLQSRAALEALLAPLAVERTRLVR
ncbi:MAG TPA: dihydroorotate dehydrogenase (quinone), partial [Anaerolineae bacterium]